MVKSSKTPIQSETTNSGELLFESITEAISCPSTPESETHDYLPIFKRNNLPQSQDPAERFKKTAIGCVMEFLRAHGPSSMAEIVQHVGSVKDTLRNPKGKIYKSDPFAIVDNIISTKYRMFPLDSNYEWTLNEEIASKYEAKHIKLTKERIEKLNRKSSKQSKRVRAGVILFEGMQAKKAEILSSVKTGDEKIDELLYKLCTILMPSDERNVRLSCELKKVIEDVYNLI